MRIVAKLQSRTNALLKSSDAVTLTTEVAFLMFMGVLVAIALYYLAEYVFESGPNIGKKVVGAFSD